MVGWTEGRVEEGVEGDEEEEEEAQSFFVRAVYDFTPADNSSLSFKQGDIIEVLTQLESGWWDGLMGGSIRGWFPSNYVEIVSEEEADEYFEQLLQQQEQEKGNQQQQQQPQQQQQQHSQANAGTQPYAGLGLVQDFDVLRSLMGARDDDSDATFEQLAEAAMRASDPNTASSHSSSTTAAVPRSSMAMSTTTGTTANGGHRSSRISDMSWRNGSYATTSTSPSNVSLTHTDLSSVAPRSTAPSISEAEKLAGFDARLAGPSERERERLRAHSLSSGHSHLAAPGMSSLGRPRAATQASSRSRASRRSENESSFWVPKVNERGEVSHPLPSSCLGPV
ncbi:hypothetical protein L7F22_057995 [Adiantum nelumboides]|nr:hypothetical protein [Adiantum nelumboides]